MIAALCGECFHRLDMRVAFRRLHTETEKETCLCCGRRRYTGLYEANYFTLGRAIRNVKHEDQVQKAQRRECEIKSGAGSGRRCYAVEMRKNRELEAENTAFRDKIEQAERAMRPFWK